jgi:group II intron reverse transcriptase/maturase/CRISPR-associated endonuclease Cas1
MQYATAFRTTKALSAPLQPTREQQMKNKNNYAPETPRPLLIAGNIVPATDLALRRVLRAKEPGQALIVVDYQGHLSTQLNDRNKGNMQRQPLLWCDLTNRRRPTALFRFTRTVGMKPALRGFLENLISLLGTTVSPATIDAVVDLAHHLTDRGNIGLAALVTSLRRPEISYTLRRAAGVAAELNALLETLEWILRFPAVWSLSEGNNHARLAMTLQRGGTAWIELTSTHFERIEHQIASLMVEAVVTDAVMSRNLSQSAPQKTQHMPILLYGFPSTCPSTLFVSSIAAKQVGVFAFSARHKLSPTGRKWIDAGADCWIAGGVGELPEKSAHGWLSKAECARLRDLELGQVWCRSGKDNTAVTAIVRPPESANTPGLVIRRQSQKWLRLSPIKQFSSAALGEAGSAPKNADIYGHLCSRQALYAGWFRVRSHNKYSQGHDHVTIEDFGTCLDIELERLAKELADGRYRSRPLKTVRIPKADGDVRVLKVACIRDRVVQAACLHLIEPLFDVRFSPMSFAYRPGRSTHHAVAMVRSAIRAGKQWAVTADIRKCFDSIDHEIVLRLIADVISDRDLIQLIRNWLVADVIDFMDVIPSELGVPQGEAISPLLANIYLDPLDKEFEKTGMTFVRYADDYVVLCDSEAEAQAALRLMSEFLEGVLRLSLKPAKTHYCHVQSEITFLGFQIGLTEIRIPQPKIAQTTEKLAELISVFTSRASTPSERYLAMVKMNSTIRGVRNYFSVDNSPNILSQFAEIDAAVEQLANQQIGEGSSLDASWAAREKFVRQVDNANRQLQTDAEVTTLTGEYPSSKFEYPAAPDDSDQIHVTTNSGNEPAAANESLQQSKDSETLQDERHPDVLTVDGRLHVMTSGCFVTINGDDLVVRRKKQSEIFRTPISEVTMLYLEGKGIAVSADLTMRLCDKDIPIVFAPLVGLPAAIAQPIQSGRAHLRQQQVLRRSDLGIISAGMKMLSAKVGNQASVLKYFARYRKRNDEATYCALTQNADEIRTIADTLGELDPATNSARAVCMGHEGRAAAKYWASFASLTPDSLGFPGRHTKHATDPVNSAINYVYGILYGEVWRAVVRAGLDPYFGIIHGSERDQGSLVFDLIEEYRAPFGDRIVLGLLGRGFALELDKEGRIRSRCRHKLAHAFYKQWRRALRWRGKLHAPSDILEMQVTSLRNTFLGKEDYRAFRFRW